VDKISVTKLPGTIMFGKYLMIVLKFCNWPGVGNKVSSVLIVEE